MEYVKADPVSLKKSSSFDEKKLQTIIAGDPQILGLGALDVIGIEKVQPNAGRLDLLLQDSEGSQRFEVEIQLGKTDESHIIRTIEYWDIERKRYSQYDHVAVIVAEDITSRFLNVISLFNGSIPLVAIQLSAVAIDGKLSLVFTRVLDQMKLGLAEEDEEVAAAADRAYWEAKVSTEALAQADQIIELVRSVDDTLDPKYNKGYIGLGRSGVANNFVFIRPRKMHVVVMIRLPRSDDLDQAIESSNLDLIDYQTKRGRYRIRLKEGDVVDERVLLEKLIRESHEIAFG